MLRLEHSNTCNIENFRLQPGGGQQEEVLRMVLAIALDLRTAAWCAGCHADAAVNRWPSTVYRLLARAALDSSSVWQRCAIVLDHALCDALEGYVDHSPAELAELFLDGRQSLRGDELAALLWCLLRERSASHDLVAERLGLELEVVAARRLHHPT